MTAETSNARGDSTPGARWRAEGKADPHGDRYACERAALAGGDMTDDEVANAVFLEPNIVNLTIAKDRIRWLSRKLAECATPPPPADAEVLVFRNDGNSDAGFIAHEANACTSCGGSGHRDDQQPEARGVVDVSMDRERARLRKYYEVTQNGIGIARMALMANDATRARAALDHMCDEIDAALTEARNVR